MTEKIEQNPIWRYHPPARRHVFDTVLKHGWLSAPCLAATWQKKVYNHSNRVVLRAAQCKTLRSMDGASLHMRGKLFTVFEQGQGPIRMQNRIFAPSLPFLFSSWRTIHMSEFLVQHFHFSPRPPVDSNIISTGHKNLLRCPSCHSGIAPVCTSHIKVSDENHVFDSMPPVDGADCSGNIFCYSDSRDEDDCGSGGGGCGCGGRRRTVTGRVVGSFWREWVEKKDSVIVRMGGVTQAPSLLQDDCSWARLCILLDSGSIPTKPGKNAPSGGEMKV